jgi:DNA-binding transcriptional ArsR family regulator
MSFDDGDLTENFKILATDDEKIKSFGEILTNDSSREILQLLFNEELTATQIAQKTHVSLQLVKYHLNKLQDLGIVKITKIEKNSKSQDMKLYTATKFSIVIVPPTLSEKTKESKMLVRSFRHIYKIMGLGIASGVSGLFSLLQINQDQHIPTNDMPLREFSPLEKSDTVFDSSQYFAGDESASSVSPPLDKSAPQVIVDDPVLPLDLTQESIDSSNVILSNDVVNSSSELFFPFVIVTIVLSGLTFYYLYKYFKKSS